MNDINRTIIACGGIESEIKAVQKRYAFNVKLISMPQNLHRNPEKMTDLLQDKINQESDEGNTVVLGYGLCSGGTAGLFAPENGLIMPKLHDCISMYLGDKEEYNKIFKKYRGTYFLTKQWIDNQLDPLGLVNNEYTERVGPEMAKEAMETELKNYNYIAFIDTPGSESEKNKYIEVAKENAKVFEKQFIEIKGSDRFFKKLLDGQYDSKGFLKYKLKEISNQNHFLK